MSPVTCTDVVAAAANGLSLSACKAFSTTCTVNKAHDACVVETTCALLT
jgi:hypothetical protein